MTEKEIRQKFKNNKCINWHKISKYQQLSEDFIREFKEYVDWEEVSCYQELSEEFVKKFKEYVDWIDISKNQQLSEEFIREFKEYVDWNNISQFQQLSEEFIKEFQDKVNWYQISQFQNLSEEFIKEYKDKVYFDLYRDYHIEKSYIQKLEEVIDFCKCFNLYYDNEYFEAYRKFGMNNKELKDLNYIQYYLPNVYYTNWRVNCNCRHKHSFGYYIYGKKIDNSYKKVKIKIEDWGTNIEEFPQVARTKGFMIK